ncbi:MAG: hypothetical protein RXR82_02815 [Nitrososphaeria archaeon]
MPANIADGAPYKYNLNFRNVFRTPEELFGDKEIVYLDRRVKYREFFSRVRRVCGGLGGSGSSGGTSSGSWTETPWPTWSSTSPYRCTAPSCTPSTSATPRSPST